MAKITFILAEVIVLLLAFVIFASHAVATSPDLFFKVLSVHPDEKTIVVQPYVAPVLSLKGDSFAKTHKDGVISCRQSMETRTFKDHTERVIVYLCDNDMEFTLDGVFFLN